MRTFWQFTLCLFFFVTSHFIYVHYSSCELFNLNFIHLSVEEFQHFTGGCGGTGAKKWRVIEIEGYKWILQQSSGREVGGVTVGLGLFFFLFVADAFLGYTQVGQMANCRIV